MIGGPVPEEGRLAHTDNYLYGFSRLHVNEEDRLFLSCRWSFIYSLSISSAS